MDILQYLKVYHFDKKIRLGCDNDGGYVIAELGKDYDCYISAGVANEESFSRDFINKYEMNKKDCFAYDGTIADYPYEYTTNINFEKKNINVFSDKNNTNLNELIDRYNKIFLKMDIEGSEYNWIKGLSEERLKHFKQIVIEFHGINSNMWFPIYELKVEALQKLSKTHYLIHAHGNNHSHLVCGVPDVMELTFINKDLFKQPLKYNKRNLPIPNLDYPNKPNTEDYDLTFYPFVRTTKRKLIFSN